MDESLDSRHPARGAIDRVFDVLLGRNETPAELLKRFADERGGRFTDQDLQGNFSGKVEIDHGGTSVTVILGASLGRAYPAEFILITCAVDAKREFTFKLADQNLGHDAFELFGIKDVQVGIPEIDKRFLIRTKQPELILQLLEDKKVRELIEDPRYGRVVMQRQSADSNRYSIQFDLSGRAAGIEDLSLNFARFTALLDRLNQLGVI